MSNKKTSTISNITLSPSEKYFDVKDVTEYPNISSITTNSSVRGFNPENVPHGFIHLERVNQMPTGGDFYAILPNSNNKISKITPYGINKDTNKFSFIEGWRGKDWQSMLREPKYEIDLNDDYVYIYMIRIEMMKLLNLLKLKLLLEVKRKQRLLNINQEEIN